MNSFRYRQHGLQMIENMVRGKWGYGQFTQFNHAIPDGESCLG